MDRPRLRIQNPFRLKTEVVFIFAILAACIAVSLTLWPLGLRRGDLMLRIPPSEANGAFLTEELENKTGPLDVVFIGDCLVWWQVFTPDVQSALSQAWARDARVITLGFNHFGADVTYLLARDLLEKRAVKNIVLPLPKIEDFNEFPHRGAVNWWIYPADLDGGEALSARASLRLMGLSLFTSFRRLTSILTKRPAFAADAGDLGFNSGRRQPAIDDDAYLTKFDFGVAAKTDLLSSVARGPSALLTHDWMIYFRKLADLGREKGVNFVFIDSPHAAEFETDEATVAWGFEKFFPADTKVVTLNFRDWRDRQRDDVRGRIYEGHNLTFDGARAYTRTILPALTEAVRR